MIAIATIHEHMKKEQHGIKTIRYMDVGHDKHSAHARTRTHTHTHIPAHTYKKRPHAKSSTKQNLTPKQE